MSVESNRHSDSTGSLTRRNFLNVGSGVAAASVIGIKAGKVMAQNLPSNPTDLGVVDLVSAIMGKELSCREVMQACLDHIDAENPTYNAIITRQKPETLLAAADSADATIASGAALGLMHGVPQAPKDMTATSDMPTTQGSPIFKEYIPKRDSIMVERMRSAGAIFVGKTNTPEFGLGSHTYNSVFGTTYNAWHSDLSAGGSSGGAAVALARHMLPVADGSDMMGSLRNPAGWNNVVGFRPTQGRIPFGPTGEVFMQQLAYEGAMGRTVADAAYLFSVQAGYDARSPLSLADDPSQFRQNLSRDFKGTRIGFLGDFTGYLPTEPGVLEICRFALKNFEDLGCTVDEASLEFDMELLWQTWLTLREFTIAGIAGPLYDNEKSRVLMKPEAIWEIENGMKLTGQDVWTASANRSAFYHSMCKLFRNYDYLVLPSAQIFPFDASQDWPKEIAGKQMDTYHRWMEIVVPGTLSGMPIAAVPAGFGPKGASQPMGLQIIGPQRADLSVLQMANAYEQASGFSSQRAG